MREQMKTQRTTGTAPELALRRALFCRGLRYRVNYTVNRSPQFRADVAFPRRRLAIFVDGCFWHCCPEHGEVPRSNRDFWIARFDTNVRRDVQRNTVLVDCGWRVMQVWEHELSTPKDISAVAGRVVNLVRGHET